MKHKQRRLISAWSTTAALLLLAACGGADGSATPSAFQSDVPSIPASPRPGSALGDAAALPATEMTTPRASEASAPDNTFAGLQQSMTAEGHPVLGNPDAPTTITMYSDFL